VVTPEAQAWNIPLARVSHVTKPGYRGDWKCGQGEDQEEGHREHGDSKLFWNIP
jgi:hypothetical protein